MCLELSLAFYGDKNSSSPMLGLKDALCGMERMLPGKLKRWGFLLTYRERVPVGSEVFIVVSVYAILSYFIDFFYENNESNSLSQKMEVGIQDN